MMPRYFINQQPLIESFEHRLGIYHPTASIQVGSGNTNGGIITVQSHAKMPDRDAITGALKNFGMLRDAYRATSMIVDSSKVIRTQQLRVESSMTPDEINRYYLRELIEIIRPSLVIACGPQALSMLRDRKVRSFSSHAGKKFRVADIKDCVFFATIDPSLYGFARAPVELKKQGKEEWTEIASIYNKLKQKLIKERWEC